MKIGYLPSSFDMVNVRDLDLISQAKALCDHLVLGVFSDDFAEDQHGRRPVVPLVERVALLQHMRGVQQVVVHSDEAVEAVLGGGNDSVIFTISDEGTVVAGETVELRVDRVTSSRILRDALAPARVAAVA